VLHHCFWDRRQLYLSDLMPNIVKVAQVALEILVPTAGPAPPPAPSASVVITLYGWKLYKDEPCEDAIPGLELPPVDRAV
jgi:hypothetical protein